MCRLILMMMLLLPANFAGAKERVVEASDGALLLALETAQAGDILRLMPGSYDGPILIQTSLTIDGSGKATIDGKEVGSTITVDAPNVTLRGLTVQGSGSGGGGLDAGITLTKKADGSTVEDSLVLGNLIGIDIHGPQNVTISGNIIEGRQSGRMNDRGNGVYVWNAPGTKVVGNDIRWGRDGIFVNTSKNNEFIGNRFRDLRFAVHYMYAHDSVVSGNISIGNHLGYAIMYSENVLIQGNLSRGDRDHGIMMNYTNSSVVTGNRIQQVGDKCVFIYNAHKNKLTGNLFQGCNIGVHFTAGSERNEITGNSFVGNRTQVKYVGSRWLDWSTDGRGNHWSDHAAFDLDGNGIADAAYRPNDVMDHVLWTQPAAKMLLGSPAVQLIRWSQTAFPALLPGGVIDRAPLMQRVEPKETLWEGLQ